MRDMQSRQGIMHFRIKGKRDKIRFVPIHPMVLRLIANYPEIGKHGGGPDLDSAAKEFAFADDNGHYHP
jgi:hypothetical protein